jgi:phosphoribosylamine-glycine ligase
MTVNISCFAPTKDAAQLEGSKVFAKDFMARHGIPTADHRAFTDYQTAKVYL